MAKLNEYTGAPTFLGNDENKTPKVPTKFAVKVFSVTDSCKELDDLLNDPSVIIIETNKEFTEGVYKVAVWYESQVK